VIVPKKQPHGEATEDGLLEVVLDSGAEEVNDLGESFEIVSEATDLVVVRESLQAAGVDYDSADSSFLPTTEVPLDKDGAKKMFRIIEALEDSDDVQNVYANGDVPDEVLAELDAED
jgi:transcriptional/translational regulatory protein YebC/TACO1